MMEERYHATAQNRFYPDISNVNKNITVEAKLVSPTMYMRDKRLNMIVACRPTRKFLANMCAVSCVL